MCVRGLVEHIAYVCCLAALRLQTAPRADLKAACKEALALALAEATAGIDLAMGTSLHADADAMAQLLNLPALRFCLSRSSYINSNSGRGRGRRSHRGRRGRRGRHCRADREHREKEERHADRVRMPASTFLSTRTRKCLWRSCLEGCPRLRRA